MNFYHGGYGGLSIGDLILPPSETGASSCSEFGAAMIHRTDRVYVTTDINAAFFFAALHPTRKGALYLVEPIGELTDDPDCTTNGHSFECEKARIVDKKVLPKKVRNKIIKKMLPKLLR